jgi:hypothetical protein
VIAMTDTQKNVLLAVRDVQPKRRGAAKLDDIRASSYVNGPNWIDDRVLDRALQALRRGGLIKYVGKRGVAGIPRARWGWTLTRTGYKAVRS